MANITLYLCLLVAPSNILGSFLGRLLLYRDVHVRRRNHRRDLGYDDSFRNAKN